jgi:hypothetical protein
MKYNIKDSKEQFTIKRLKKSDIWEDFGGSAGYKRTRKGFDCYVYLNRIKEHYPYRVICNCEILKIVERVLKLGLKNVIKSKVEVSEILENYPDKSDDKRDIAHIILADGKFSGSNLITRVVNFEINKDIIYIWIKYYDYDFESKY